MGHKFFPKKPVDPITETDLILEYWLIHGLRTNEGAIKRYFDGQPHGKLIFAAAIEFLKEAGTSAEGYITLCRNNGITVSCPSRRCSCP